MRGLLYIYYARENRVSQRTRDERRNSRNVVARVPLTQPVAHYVNRRRRAIVCYYFFPLS